MARQRWPCHPSKQNDPGKHIAGVVKVTPGFGDALTLRELEAAASAALAVLLALFHAAVAGEEPSRPQCIVVLGVCQLQRPGDAEAMVDAGGRRSFVAPSGDDWVLDLRR